MGFSRDHGPCKAAGRTQSPRSPQSFLRTTVNAEPAELAERRPPAPDGTTVDAEPAELAEGRPARDGPRSGPTKRKASHQTQAGSVMRLVFVRRFPSGKRPATPAAVARRMPLRRA